MATPVVSVDQSTIANDNATTGVTSLLVPGTSVVTTVLGNQAAVAPIVSASTSSDAASVQLPVSVSTSVAAGFLQYVYTLVVLPYNSLRSRPHLTCCSG